MTSSIFPDLNVWIALTLDTHQHHEVAWRWYVTLPDTVDLVFCRFTQIGFLRLLTSRAVTGDGVLTQGQAWAAYDRWILEGDCVFAEEPLAVEVEFRALANATRSSPKEWADSYLAAFAAASAMDLITLDKALYARARSAVLLG
jgi:toxin-antitoxin system PIN domain toxin